MRDENEKGKMREKKVNEWVMISLVDSTRKDKLSKLYGKECRVMSVRCLYVFQCAISCEK